MSTKVRLTYRFPSFLEGASRVFDIAGVLRDEVEFDTAVLKDEFDLAHTRKSRRCFSNHRSGTRIAGSEVITETDAINLAIGRINHSMAVAGTRMRR